MDDPLNALFWRDEILQIMYWLRGEGLSERVEPHDLIPFLDAGEDLVQECLDRLVDEDFATREDGIIPRYQLTEWGVKEGGRRFAEAFSDLTRQAHGVCNNPNCSCQTLGPAACETQVPHSH